MNAMTMLQYARGPILYIMPWYVGVFRVTEVFDRRYFRFLLGDAADPN
jgi:hypothetical protein